MQKNINLICYQINYQVSELKNGLSIQNKKTR